MKIDFITLLGLIAGILTTLAYLPQAIKTWQSKSADDISWSMLIILSVGIVLWLVYGVSIRNIPLIVANVVTFFLTSIILVLKIRYKNVV
ncbi:SemiSWEET family sugar transporter [Hydrococcus rivularis]|uniref:SemiSWEET family sugar transporter n=1 Tax=Hydrococcus rivularis TaxID=1616834 RepID=UPI0009F91CD7|nr:SemiSWEET transporter [Hydrococcus rivularis]